MLSVFALKNPGEGRVDRFRYQKPLVGRVFSCSLSKNPGRGFYVAVLALKNPGEG